MRQLMKTHMTAVRGPRGKHGPDRYGKSVYQGLL